MLDGDACNWSEHRVPSRAGKRPGGACILPGYSEARRRREGSGRFRHNQLIPSPSDNVGAARTLTWITSAPGSALLTRNKGNVSTTQFCPFIKKHSKSILLICHSNRLSTTQNGLTRFHEKTADSPMCETALCARLLEQRDVVRDASFIAANCVCCERRFDSGEVMMALNLP